MKVGMIGTLAVAALAVAGCGKKDDGAKAGASEAPKIVAAAKAPVDPGAVMVSVNGKKITRGEIDADVEKIIAAQKVPAEQVEDARKMLGERLAGMFLQKALLLGAAEAKGIKLTEAEFKAKVDELLKKISTQPGAPKTLDELAEKATPFGKERSLQEIRENFVIQKLVEQEIVSKIKVDEKKVDEVIQNATSNATVMAKKVLDAEANIKSLKKLLDGLTGAALTNKFAELAKEKSDCPSREKGGDLGEFTHGQMVKEFDEVAFKSEPFKVSDPVKTQFGWHLIMVTKKIPAVEAKGDTPASPEKVRASHILLSAREAQKVPTKEQVEQGLKRQQEQQAMGRYLEKLRAAAKIEAPGYPNLLPKPPAAKPAAKAIESKPVEVKPAAKPAEAKK